ncbi:CDF manganese transporter [Mycena floridula]|nr:CDF manganese transporter [Mycena floridula]
MQRTERMDPQSTITQRRTISVDPEVASITNADDPLFLRNGHLSPNQLDDIKRQNSGKRAGKTKVLAYQEKQNELIDSVLKPIETHSAEAKAAEDAARVSVKIAIWASFISNVALSVLQMYAAVSSGSLSFLATALDSVFDPVSNVILLWLHRKAQRLDQQMWPVGGSRLETAGNIVYGFMRVTSFILSGPCSCSASRMSAVNLIIIVESIQDILNHKKDDEVKAFFIPAVAAVSTALGVKILLFMYCFSIRKHSSQVQVLWEDHRNDLFVNGFGLLMSAGGSKLAWFLDPMGAIIIALGTSSAWIRTIYKEFELLVGKSAPREFIQLITYNVVTYSQDISGPEYFVEVDIVMDPETSLRHAHDISQALQDKIETLPDVNRAFVHVDHESSHSPVCSQTSFFNFTNIDIQEHRKQV